MFATGQIWRYRAPSGFEDSRIVIGAIATFPDQSRIICVSVTDAPAHTSDGPHDRIAIAFIPLREDAFASTVTTLDAASDATTSPEFADGFYEWNSDPRGLTCFTVPFEGRLDHLIAKQMAAIVGVDAA
jgi:hypothetical protein